MSTFVPVLQQSCTCEAGAGREHGSSAEVLVAVSVPSQAGAQEGSGRVNNHQEKSGRMRGLEPSTAARDAGVRMDGEGDGDRAVSAG